MTSTVHELPGFPSVGDAVTTVLNAIGNSVWKFADSILSAVFGLVDGAVTPTIVYTPDGPLGKIYPITLWLGLFLAICFGFAAAGKVALSGGQGIFGLLKGLALYAFVTAAGLGVLDTVKSASDATARGILSAMLNVNSWSSLSSNSTFMGGSIKGLSGIALALVSLFLIIPFGVGFLFEIIIRTGAMEILAATYPILTAGLVNEKFARWYWTGLRWMLALIFMTPLIALALGIGQSIAQGGSSDSTTQALGTALVGGVVSNMSLLTPFALFKLFAFIDPNTASGQTARSAFGGGSSAAGQSQGSSGDSESADGGGQDDADGAGGMKPGGDSGSSQNGAGIMSAMNQLMGQGQDKAQDSNSAATQQASSSLDAVGAGHPGGGQPGSDSDSDEKDHSDSDTDADSDTSNGSSGSGGDSSTGGQGGPEDPSPTNPGDVPGGDAAQDPLGGGSSPTPGSGGGFDDPSGGQGGSGGGPSGGQGGSGGGPSGGQGTGGDVGANAGGGAGSEAAVAAV